MRNTYVVTFSLVFLCTLAVAQDSLDTQTSALIARAASLELNTDSVPPPGDPLEHHASGFAKVLCSAVFVTGLDPEFAAENIGYFTAPYEERASMGKSVTATLMGLLIKEGVSGMLVKR
jgi:hypothetical protein